MLNTFDNWINNCIVCSYVNGRKGKRKLKSFANSNGFNDFWCVQALNMSDLRSKCFSLICKQCKHVCSPQIYLPLERWKSFPFEWKVVIHRHFMLQYYGNFKWIQWTLISSSKCRLLLHTQFNLFIESVTEIIVKLQITISKATKFLIFYILIQNKNSFHIFIILI